jgi:hypothetical protein
LTPSARLWAWQFAETGGGEQKRLGRVPFAVGAGLQNSHVGFLHEVVDIESPTETAGEPRAQHRLVRLHVSGKPLAKFGIGRGHGGNAGAVGRSFLCRNSRADYWPQLRARASGPGARE